MPNTKMPPNKYMMNPIQDAQHKDVPQQTHDEPKRRCPTAQDAPANMMNQDMMPPAQDAPSNMMNQDMMPPAQDTQKETVLNRRYPSPKQGYLISFGQNTSS